jgi:nucleolar complex protein 3
MQIKGTKQRKKNEAPKTKNGTSKPQATGFNDVHRDPTTSRRKTLSASEYCDIIAQLSESILEKPDQAFVATENPEIEGSSPNPIEKGPSKIQQLISIADKRNGETQQYPSRLAIMSLLAIFKDILPAYRIRLPSTDELAVKVSKETKKVWDHERSLLQHYQLFLKTLERAWVEGKQQSAPNVVAITAALSLAELLKTAYQFNFRSNLLSSVVRNMNCSKSEAVSNASCEAIEYVFSHDSQGDVALEATRQVCKLIKDCSFRVKPLVIRTFMSLPLRVHVDEAQAAKLMSKSDAKKRKRDKDLSLIESELRESHTGVDKVVLARCQSDMLQAITLIYFRILKSVDISSSRINMLLPPALEGLGKFSHLINIDTVVDVLGVLKDLMKNVEHLQLDANLNCVLTSFRTLQGPGKEMQIDPKDYIKPLYSQLPRLDSSDVSEKSMETMLECLSSAFLKRREYSNARVAAFMKQIFTTAMHTPPHIAMPLLVFARHLLQRYASVEQLLENEQDVITAGAYCSSVEDPDLSNAFSTSAWELATLKFHIHAGIAREANSAASWKKLQIPGDSPESILRQEFKNYCEFAFLHKRKRSSKSVVATSITCKRRKISARFVKPPPIRLCSSMKNVTESVFHRNLS